MHKKIIICPTCGGSGRVASLKIPGTLEDCPICEKSGRVWEISSVKYEPYKD